MQETVIRKYLPADRDSVRRIAYDTAFMGEPASSFFDTKEIVEDFLTEYFTDYEPDSCFVAETNKKVIGYVIGAKDSRLLDKIFIFRILPRLAVKFIKEGAIFNKKNLTFIFHLLKSCIKSEFSSGKVSGKYPAVLHINIDKDFRSSGVGSRLIGAFFDYLAREKVPGVHLATMSATAASFFKKQGFKLLASNKRSYFNYILKKDTPVYLMAKDFSFGNVNH